MREEHLRPPAYRRRCGDDLSPSAEGVSSDSLRRIALLLHYISEQNGRAMTKGKKLGEIFVEKGLITQKTLERALVRANRQKKKLGYVLEEIEVITGEEMAAALAIQFGYKVVSDFAKFKFPPALLDMIPADVAMEYILFPLKIEAGKIAIAMADPTENRIVSNIAANSGLALIPYIATRKDIIAAINRHYLGQEAAVRREKTILVVEDDQMLFALLRDVLSKEGYKVVVARDGMEGYKTALTAAPHVILTDQVMPKLDGFGLFDALKNHPETRNIPVILITAKADGNEEATAFEKGFFDFMVKPVREVTLVTRVKRAFLESENRQSLFD
jgi:CheY-like chemotaxis protein